jgi:hypothetical protein
MFGTRMRRGQLFRWSAVDETESADPRRLALGTVIDTAIVADGSCTALGWVARSWHRLPLIESIAVQLRDVRDEDAVDVGVALESSDSVAEVLAILTDPSAYPAAIGCSAAPDATATIMTLLLGWLGIPDTTIAMSPECLTSPGSDSPLCLLRGLRHEFGSVDGYAQFLGLSSALGYLRTALLVDHSVAQSA